MSFVPKVVVPRGGLRAFRYNGRLYRLLLRRQLLIHYHDNATMGMHYSAEDTLAKLAKQFVWPGMEHDVRRWIFPESSPGELRVSEKKPGAGSPGSDVRQRSTLLLARTPARRWPRMRGYLVTSRLLL